MCDLSIVIPTCNRATLLGQLLGQLRNVQSKIELIVVNGASTDGTRDVLKSAGDVWGTSIRVIHEEKREGFVKAANKGFRIAKGRNLMWLNDDARPIGSSIDNAISQIDSSPSNVGLLAMFHRYSSQKNVAFETVHDQRVFRICHVRGTLYANFAIGKRHTFASLGFFDERFFLYGADPDLSLRAWQAGYRVEPAYLAYIDHDEHADDRRAADSSQGASDNAKLFAKWDLPAKNALFNAFDPQRPCTLRGMSESTLKIA